jgi:hypothetical protein
VIPLPTGRQAITPLVWCVHAAQALALRAANAPYIRTPQSFSKD